MVRIMVGTTFEIYKGKLDLSYIKDNFENPNADIKKYIAQESGLYLYDVEWFLIIFHIRKYWKIINFHIIIFGYQIIV